MAQVVASSHDFTPATIAPEEVGARIVECLGEKGFCAFLPGIPEGTLSKALDDVAEIALQGRFDELPTLIAEGLLGESGSAKVAELDAPELDADLRRDGANIGHLDQAMTQLGLQVMPYLPYIDVSLWARTIGLLHQAASDDQGREDVELVAEEGHKWLTTFAEHKLMLLLCLGPDSATLELRPFEEDAESWQVTLQPGTMMCLQPDILGRTLTTDGRCTALSCFYQGIREARKHKEEAPVMSPVVQQLEDWARERLLTIKQADPIAADEIVLPRRWEQYKNHMGFTTQPVGIQAVAGRSASTWNIDEFVEIGFPAGVDTATTVPFSRWDHEKFWAPDAELAPSYIEPGHGDFASYEAKKDLKTCCRHACFVDGVDLFDQSKFRLSRAEGLGMDPGQRLLLEVGYENLLKGGYKGKLMNSRGAVMVAANGFVEWGFTPKDISGGGGVAACNANNSVAAGRFSFVHGMKGPCIAFDQENAGSLVATTYASTILTQLGTWERAPYALVMSYSLILSQLVWLQKSVQGDLSRTGRVMSFDESCDGHVRGEACASIVLKPMVDDIDKQPVLTKGAEDFIAEIAGSGQNQNGRANGLASRSIAGEQDAIHAAIRKADISPLDVEMCECHGIAALLSDAVETSAIGRAYRPDGMIGLDESCAFNLCCSKTVVGNQTDSHGLTQLIKVSSEIQRGSMSPMIHLRMLNPYVDISSCERPMMIGSECIDFDLNTTYAGCHGSNVSGTNVHVIVWGHLDTVKHAPWAARAPQVFGSIADAEDGDPESAAESGRLWKIRGPSDSPNKIDFSVRASEEGQPATG
mmetsp:Transcript_64566/g.154258  ORF Transcript_64566/g.154258 Transcript_64566/m.154258 type:complete len:812 (-) Transcript_64566:222-2657(-)